MKFIFRYALSNWTKIHQSSHHFISRQFPKLGAMLQSYCKALTCYFGTSSHGMCLKENEQEYCSVALRLKFWEQYLQVLIQYLAAVLIMSSQMMPGEGECGWMFPWWGCRIGCKHATHLRALTRYLNWAICEHTFPWWKILWTTSTR